MKKYKINIFRDVTQQQIDDMMAAMFHTAISYWCGEIRYKTEPTEKVEFMSDALTRGGTYELWDFEEEKWLTLDLDKFLKAMSKINFMDEDYDDNDVDDIVQNAVFGEVIYG